MQKTKRIFHGLSRDTIKYIAILAMVLNHIANTLLENPYGTAAIILEDIGYITAPIMCYFLVEGLRYTHDKKKYGLRLFLFSLISIVPYYITIPELKMNMIWTLFLCFLLLCVLHHAHIQTEIRGVFIFILIFLTYFSDWGVVAPIMVILFDRSYGNKKKTLISSLISAVLYGMNCWYSYYAWALDIYHYPKGASIRWGAIQGFFGGLPVAIAGLVICFLYSGKKMQIRSRRGQLFNRWFFYVFYPAHLLVLHFLAGVI